MSISRYSKFFGIIVTMLMVSTQVSAAPTATSHHRSTAHATPNPTAQRVNINHADVTTLSAIKGVGPKRANAIVDWRQQHGDFKAVNDLLQVKGIGTKLLAQVSSQLTVADIPPKN